MTFLESLLLCKLPWLECSKKKNWCFFFPQSQTGHSWRTNCLFLTSHRFKLQTWCHVYSRRPIHFSKMAWHLRDSELLRENVANTSQEDKWHTCVLLYRDPACFHHRSTLSSKLAQVFIPLFQILQRFNHDIMIYRIFCDTPPNYGVIEKKN